MDTYNKISFGVFFLVIFGIYRFSKKRKRLAPLTPVISEENIKVHLQDADKEREITVRKQWLISFFILMAWSVISILPIFIHEGGLFTQLSGNMDIAFSSLFALAVSFLVIVPWFWITYHCSYKKSGSAWLLWTMISLPFREIVNIAKGEYSHLAEWDSIGWFLVSMSFGIRIFYWVNCLRLYKINCTKEYAKLLVIREKYGPNASGFGD